MTLTLNQIPGYLNQDMVKMYHNEVSLSLYRYSHNTAKKKELLRYEHKGSIYNQATALITMKHLP